MPRWKKISGNPPNPRHPRSILHDYGRKFYAWFRVFVFAFRVNSITERSAGVNRYDDFPSVKFSFLSRRFGKAACIVLVGQTTSLFIKCFGYAVFLDL
jgi:hypothetical protein